MGHKIISCAGFGNTGSSAVTNFFEEFSNVSCIGSSGFEFMLLHEPDGIYDLYKTLLEGHRLKTDMAIKRFIMLVFNLNYQNPSGPNYSSFFNGHFLEYTIDYLKSLGLQTWKGDWYRNNEVFNINSNDFIIKQKKYQKYMKKFQYSLYEPDTWKPVFSYRTDMFYMKTNKEDFILKTKKYLERLFEECDIENKYEYLLFDQIVPNNCNDDYIQFFDDIYIIIVDRDPRDLFFGNKVFWNCGYIPTSDVKIFIEWYKATRNVNNSNSRILKINFEDLVYDYDNISKTLINFVKINKKYQIKRQKIFIPEKSKSNTFLWMKYDIDNFELFEGINKIENELHNYCVSYYDSLAIKNIKKIFLPCSTEDLNFKINDINFSIFYLLLFSAYYNAKESINKKYKVLLFPILFFLHFIKVVLKQFLFLKSFRMKQNLSEFI